MGKENWPKEEGCKDETALQKKWNLRELDVKGWNTDILIPVRMPLVCRSASVAMI